MCRVSCIVGESSCVCKGSCEGGAWLGLGLGSRMSLMAGVPGLEEGVGSGAVGVALGVSFRVRVRVGSLRMIVVERARAPEGSRLETASEWMGLPG